MTVGAIEKLGVFPGAISGAYYVVQLVRKENLQGTYAPIVFGGLAILYALASRQLFVAFRLEQLALMAKRATGVLAAKRRP